MMAHYFGYLTYVNSRATQATILKLLKAFFIKTNNDEDFLLQQHGSNGCFEVPKQGLQTNKRFLAKNGHLRPNE
jgi:hypothetical protein